MHDITMNESAPPCPSKPLLVLIAGSYLFGEWLALPIIHAAGGRNTEDEVFRAYQYPVANRLLERCDAVLRIPGASRGADLDVARAIQLGLRVYNAVTELPPRGDILCNAK